LEKADAAQGRQLFRFCLYGFLKNLQFFEPFLILAFRDRGFSFSAIGILIAFRAICVNILEIPSGALADVMGRRRSMIVSMIAYIASFIVFAMAGAYWAFFPAMLLFAVGDAFRTGTHKAMIFDWLTRQGRTEEKSRIYGLTRSWSKQGSALNCIVAAAILIATKDYRWVFLLATVPYVFNVINFMMYPAYLDGERDRKKSVGGTLKSALGQSFSRQGLRNLIVENICYEGFFSTIKEFLQPTLKAVALSLPFFVAWSHDERTAVLVAIVYMILNQLSSLASRQSHRAVKAAGGEARLATRLWWIGLLLYVLIGAGFVFEWGVLAVSGFVVLAVVFNIWKPVLVARFHDRADLDTAATTLSVANQGKSLAVVVLAPLLGWAVDWVAGPGLGADSVGLFALWPVAAAGAIAAAAGLIVNARGKEEGIHRRGAEAQRRV
jgi:MFS family permease